MKIKFKTTQEIYLHQTTSEGFNCAYVNIDNVRLIRKILRKIFGQPEHEMEIFNYNKVVGYVKVLNDEEGRKLVEKVAEVVQDYVEPEDYDGAILEAVTDL